MNEQVVGQQIGTRNAAFCGSYLVQSGFFDNWTDEDQSSKLALEILQVQTERKGAQMRPFQRRSFHER